MPALAPFALPLGKYEAEARVDVVRSAVAAAVAVANHLALLLLLKFGIIVLRLQIGSGLAGASCFFGSADGLTLDDGSGRRGAPPAVSALNYFYIIWRGFHRPVPQCGSLPSHQNLTKSLKTSVPRFFKAISSRWNMRNFTCHTGTGMLNFDVEDKFIKALFVFELVQWRTSRQARRRILHPSKSQYKSLQ